VRRVGAAGLVGGQPGGEGRGAQRQPARVRGHRQRQDAAGAGLLRRRLLRRRPRLRRPRRPRAGRGRRVPGAGGAEGRQRLLGAGGGREPAAADGEREPADAGVRRQGAEPGRDGGAVGGAH
ncbi:hypothetical protein ACJX0J_005422, partial [Zea mays]